MISSISRFLRKHALAPQDDRDDDGNALQLATAALLMEVAAADHEISEAERDAIRNIVREKFPVTPEEAAAIAAKAEQDSGQLTSIHPFTRLLVTECSLEDRVGIVSMLWQVTVADDRIDAHEEHLVRRIAGLLYVPHSQFIRTRLQHQDN